MNKEHPHLDKFPFVDEEEVLVQKSVIAHENNPFSFTAVTSDKSHIGSEDHKVKMDRNLHPLSLRHNPCLMTPLSTLLVLLLALIAVITFILSIPTYILGFFSAILVSRSNYLIEFLYPASFVRSAHLMLMKFAMKRNMRKKGHSQTIETRYQITKNVYVHAIPQFLDNIAYLIVWDLREGDESGPLPGILIDVGDADAAWKWMASVSAAHYSNREIDLSAVLSTHKHHDHTAGNREALKRADKIYGGAVERVPYCTDLVKNGDMIPLPGALGKVCEMEVIAVPSHTRGSVVYALRSKGDGEEFLFTGDAMFAAGGGIPFEAEVLESKKDNVKTKNWRSPVRPAAGMNSIERVFAEIMFRTERPLIFPGHEYTYDLLQRQFDPRLNNFTQDWTNNTSIYNTLPAYLTFSPRVFFNTASHYFLSGHKRSLPVAGGRMLTVPTPLDRELDINPHFRTLVKKGHNLLTALRIWYQFLAPPDTSEMASINFNSNAIFPSTTKQRHVSSPKPPSTTHSWTVTPSQIRHEVFTTVYTSDLHEIIALLHQNKISPQQAALELSSLSSKIDIPLVEKFPLKNTLCTQNMIWLGSLSLAILGSPPTAMTVSDAKKMNLPPPIKPTKSDYIQISKSRLIRVLYSLKLLSSENCLEIKYIHLLWKETHKRLQPQDLTDNSENPPSLHDEANDSLQVNPNYSTLEEPGQDEIPDELPLGLLKMTLYGITEELSSRTCLPCSSSKKSETPVIHPGSSDDGAPQIKRSGGEMVRHSIRTCPICRHSSGWGQEGVLEKEGLIVLPCGGVELMTLNERGHSRT